MYAICAFNIPNSQLWPHLQIFKSVHRCQIDRKGLLPKYAEKSEIFLTVYICFRKKKSSIISIFKRVPPPKHKNRNQA